MLAIPRLQSRFTNKLNKAADNDLVLNPYGIPESYADFLRECCRIRSGNKIIPFLPYDYQVEISRLIDDYRGVMIYKTRQMGATECIAAKFLHKALLNPAYAGVVLSMGQSESSNVAVRIQNMPAKIKSLQWKTKSKTEIQPIGCGKVWFRPSTDNAARSLESVSDIFIDEHAFIENAEELYASAAPTQEAVGEDAKTVIASTMSPEGELSTFWQMFAADNDCDAKEQVERVKDGREGPLVYWVDKSGWVKCILHWRANPIYSKIPDYLEKTKREKKLTEDKLQREYNLGMPSSGGILFNQDAVKAAQVGGWESCIPEHTYICCVDPNFGGADYFCAQLWDVTQKPYSLVNEYCEQGRRTNYSVSQVLRMCDAYEIEMLVIESNSGGVAIAEKFIEMRPSWRIEQVRTTQSNKITNTDRLAIMIENGELIFPAEWDGAKEMGKFSLKDRKANTGHDDRVMAAAIGFAFADEYEQMRDRANEVMGFTVE